MNKKDMSLTELIHQDLVSTLKMGGAPQRWQGIETEYHNSKFMLVTNFMKQTVFGSVSWSVDWKWKHLLSLP